MSDSNRMRERIAGVFSGALHLDVPAFDTDLFDTGVLDSMAFVELLLHLEHEFGVTTAVDDLEPENFRSIDSIAEFVRSRTSATVVPIGKLREDDHHVAARHHQYR